VAPAARRALAAAVLALAAPGALAMELGTLFHTPEERARLERLRRGEPEVAPGAAARTGRREITGFVKRSDGRSTVWIDGAPVEGATPEAVRRLDAKAVRAYSERSDETLKVERKAPR
jgi:hypothetical protein